MTDLSSKEVAERIGVSMSTLKNWAVRLPVPSRLAEDGSRCFPEEALAVLEAVKHLRHEQRSYETIRRTISPQSDEAPDAREEAPVEAPAATAEAPVLETVVPQAVTPEVAAAAVVEPVEASPVAAAEAVAPTEETRVESPAIEAMLEPAGSTALDNAPPELAVVMARVLEVLNEQNALAETYASTRQRVGELEMALRVAQDDRLRMQLELAEARRLLGQQEIAQARRPWWRRLFDI